VTWAAAAAVVVGIVVVSLVLQPSPGGEVPVSADAVAVFPFAVRGSQEIAYLEEGMVDLLSAKLDGAGDLSSVDPHTVLSLVRQGGEELDPTRARVMAQRAGAGLYILGSVVELGGRLQLRGSLYGSQEGTVPIAQASREGSTEELFELVDRLVAELLAVRYGEASQRLAQLAARTTPSFDALKAYLEGERTLRAGRWDEARRAFARAVEADTTFALANYRLAALAGWGSGEQQPPITRGAVGRAARHLDGLAPRDRQLIEAFVTYVRDVSAAERIYRDLVNRYPDEVEGWFWLGDLLLMFDPVRGRSIGSARERLERVLALDPTHNRALVHLMEVAALQRRYAEFDSLLRRMDPLATFVTWARATQAAVRGDSTDRARARAELQRKSDVDVVATVVHTAFLLDDLEHVEQLTEVLTRPERPPITRARGHVLLATLIMAQGQRRRAWEELVEAEALDGVSAIEHHAMLVTLPFVDVGDSALVQVRSAVRRWDASAAPMEASVDHTYSLHPHLRAYLLGLVNGRLGDYRAALEYADSVEHLATVSGAVSPLGRDFANGVRAHVAWRQGNIAEALALLEQVPERRRRSDRDRQIWRPFFSQLLERFLHAEILVTLGRDAEALPWYESFVAHDGYAVLYHAPAARRQGEIAERLDQPEAAAQHYARFLELWKDADPALQPSVQDVEQRRERLTRGGAR
jgi:tetratricopeptide (TPR) repeat protein